MTQPRAQNEGPGRPTGVETLDGPAQVDPADLAQNLDDMAAVRRWLGHDASLWRALGAAFRRAPCGPRLVLDVATGGADLPAGLATRAHAEGLELHIVGVDLHPQVAAEARRRTSHLDTVAIVRADGLRLPIPTAAVDVALCSFTLHHFPWPQARALLGELWRVSSVGVIVSDLVPSRLACWAARVLARLSWSGHPLSRRDGLISIRRAYRPRQVARLAAEAELAWPVVVRPSPFHWVLLAPGAAFRRRRPPCAFC